MYFDIGICIFVFVCAGLGWRKGFINGIIGFVSGTVSFVAAIFISRPAAGLMNDWFQLDTRFDDILIKGNGHRINILICGIAAYIIIRLLFFILSKYVKRIKESSRSVNLIDNIAGVLLGIAKAAVTLVIVCVILYLLAAIPSVDKVVGKLMDGSVVGKYVYNIVHEYIYPTVLAYIQGQLKN